MPAALFLTQHHEPHSQIPAPSGGQGKAGEGWSSAHELQQSGTEDCSQELPRALSEDAGFGGAGQPPCPGELPAGRVGAGSCLWGSARARQQRGVSWHGAAEGTRLPGPRGTGTIALALNRAGLDGTAVCWL